MEVLASQNTGKIYTPRQIAKSVLKNAERNNCSVFFAMDKMLTQIPEQTAEFWSEVVFLSMQTQDSPEYVGIKVVPL